MAPGEDGKGRGDGGDSSDSGTAERGARGADAAYVFAATVRIEPETDTVWTKPSTFETTVFRRADPPGEPGWLYFRDTLWRGECGDGEHMRELTESALGVPITRVEFRELRTSQEYLDSLTEAIAADLDLFNASNTDEVLSKYLGSSIHVTDDL